MRSACQDLVVFKALTSMSIDGSSVGTAFRVFLLLGGISLRLYNGNLLVIDARSSSTSVQTMLNLWSRGGRARNGRLRTEPLSAISLSETAVPDSRFLLVPHDILNYIGPAMDSFRRHMHGAGNVYYS